MNAAFARKQSFTAASLAALFAAALLCASGRLAHAQDANGVCRVTTTGVNTNTGATWGAPRDLASALPRTQCTEIWVAQGAYFTVALSTGFNIRTGSQVYGGFDGTEDSRNERDWVAHVTILSGDRFQDDANTDGNHIDESYTDINPATTNSQIVVKIAGTPSKPVMGSTVLDGFTITGGDSRAIGGFGGGLSCFGVAVNNHCNPTLRNLVIAGNAATYGGGMYLNGQNHGDSSPDISHVVVKGNYATQQGAGMYLGGSGDMSNPGSGNSSPSLSDVAFYNNKSDNYGGGMYCDGRFGGNSGPILTDVTFDGNSAFYQGGAMMNYGYGGVANPNLLNVTFSNNSAQNGAAMFNNGNADGSHPSLPPGVSIPLVFNSTFYNNHANSSGGAVYNLSFTGGEASAAFINVTFANNTAAAANASGGAIYSTGAAGNGGGITNLNLENVIMWGNTAGTGSNIFMDNTHFASASLTIDDSVVQNGDASIAFGTGLPSTAYASGNNNFNGNPMLGPLTDNGGPTLTMMPGPTGDAVDHGNCSGAPPEDQRGAARPTGPGCDIGAVEFTDDTIFKNGFE